MNGLDERKGSEAVARATRHAAAAREAFRARDVRVWGSYGPALSRLALAFHVVSEDTPGVSPWDAEALDGWLREAPCSAATRDAYAFVLHVFNSDGEWSHPFNALDALARWDRENRSVFLEWAREPWWP